MTYFYDYGHPLSPGIMYHVDRKSIYVTVLYNDALSHVETCITWVLQNRHNHKSQRIQCIDNFLRVYQKLMHAQASLTEDMK